MPSAAVVCAKVERRPSYERLPDAGYFGTASRRLFEFGSGPSPHSADMGNRACG
jgi:hypothetical protein